MTQSSLFLEAIVRAVQADVDIPINVNRFKHAGIVDGLHTLLHGTAGAHRKRDSVRLCYGDGSESARFPLSTLRPPPVWDTTVRPIRVGFVSGRHPELDKMVDIYIVRDSETKRLESGADLEEEIADRAKRLFVEAGGTGPVSIEALHTGLEPVTVGFYRAVVECAIARGPAAHATIRVRPRIWTQPRVNISGVIATAEGALDRAQVLKSLDRLCGELAGFMRIERVHGDQEWLHWIPGRPMLASERDWLVRRARPSEVVLALLFQKAQYDDGRVWGI